MLAETALRLTGERLLLSGGDRGEWGGGLGDLATALVLLCDLPREVAEEVVADYGLARSLRGRGWPPQFRTRRRHVTRGPQPARPTPTPPTVVTCDTTVDLPEGRAHVRGVVFRDDACEVAVSSVGVPGLAPHRRRSREANDRRWIPEHTTVADDTGASTVAFFSGGGGADGWEGRWQTDRPLSAHTRWLEIGGVRVALGAAATPAQVRVEPLPDELLVYRYLWHRAAVNEDGPPDADLVLDVLVELGVLDSADPVLEELAAVTRWTRHGRYGGKPPRVTREPWASLFNRKRRDWATGTVPVAAATPEFDGTVVVLYDLHAQPHGFEVQARVEGDGAVMTRSSDEEVTGTPVAWWAEDDRGNSYLGRWGSHGGGGGKEITGELVFHPGLHRKARHLTLLPTGVRHRAVIEVPLPEWKRP